MNIRKALLFVILVAVAGSSIEAQQNCKRTIVAKVGVIDQIITYNRMGSQTPQAAIFALMNDIVDTNGKSCDKTQCTPGNVSLRADKRPRPIVLRANVGDCLNIQLTNLIDPKGVDSKGLPAACNQRANGNQDNMETCYVGLHIQGLELQNTPSPAIKNDASWVGANPNSLLPPPPKSGPGPTTTYNYYVPEEGTFYLYSQDDKSTGQLPASLFGSLNVEPDGAEYYRSQVTQKDLQLATAKYELYKSNFKNLTLIPRTLPKGAPALPVQGKPVTLNIIEPGAYLGRSMNAIETTDGYLYADDGHPIIDYNAVYPPGHKYAGKPILRMLLPTSTLNTYELIYSDVTAIITGPHQGEFTGQSPSFHPINASPDRRQPYREFSIHYHQPATVNIAFPEFITASSSVSQLSFVTDNTGGDNFGINYGIAGIAAEVFANRLGVGPVKDCVECKFEEFFLSSWPLGDPAMVVDHPACPASLDLKNFNNNDLPIPCNTNNPATKVYFPDDPSNVYHSYLRDHVKFRIHNAANQAHVHHQHAHQWLHTPNSDNSLYLDSQLIVPGSSYTLEIAYGGSGNRNFTAGDSIFHCHFYPHFAQGMWALWRVHDTFEAGTTLDKDGIPTTVNNIPPRALPDGEITAGTPIPAIVPLPTLGMAPIPTQVQLVNSGRSVQVNGTGNPGYPFFVPGLAGHRAPHPPMDFAVEETSPGVPKLNNGQQIPLDGGLPRHVVTGGLVVNDSFTRWDFSKDFLFRDSQHKPVAGYLKATELPENGTQPEQAAMQQHSGPPIQTRQPNGAPGLFQTNGLPPVPGAPFANPDVGLSSGTERELPPRRYKAAVIQTDAVINKAGWHYPQERLITLWGDVQPTLNGTRPPQPFFFRAESGQSIEFWHTNLVPDYYQVDDFQVRTPTDIIGQHIHLVKFDVLASDGAGNGFNYEDGTLSPDDVRDRIAALKMPGGSWNTQAYCSVPGAQCPPLRAPQPPPVEICAGTSCQADWFGAQTTVQRWSSDPLVNHEGFDRTLRSVFTHDHFGPSTHQQAGLYAALLVEPRCSQWFDPITGQQMGSKKDGGPTSWQSNVVTYHDCYGETVRKEDLADSYREFALEYQDFGLAYTNQSKSKPSNSSFEQFALFTTSNSYSLSDKQLVCPNSSDTSLCGLASEMCNNGINLFAGTSLATCNPSTAGSVTTQSCIRNFKPTLGASCTSQSVSSNSQVFYVWQPVPNSSPLTYHSYKLIPTSSQPATQQVFTENIEPGWADGQFAISSPTNSGSYNDWSASQSITLANRIQPTNNNSGNYLFVATQAGTTGTTEPTWPQASGQTVTDGTVIWQSTGVPPAPLLVSAVCCGGTNSGAYSVNYRSEPLPLRVAANSVWNASTSYAQGATVEPTSNNSGSYFFKATTAGTSGSSAPTFPQTPGQTVTDGTVVWTNIGMPSPATDLSYAYSSNVNRLIPQLNSQPALGSPINQSDPNGFLFPKTSLTPGINGGDPFTPLLRAYENDKVQVRVLTGAHVQPHGLNIHGVNWLFEPTDDTSGYRSAQGMGISEHFEMLFQLPKSNTTSQPYADYLYAPSSGVTGQTSGVWGLMRAYDGTKGLQPDLKPLPNNPNGGTPGAASVCPGQPNKHFTVVAMTAAQGIQGGSLIYNSRNTNGISQVTNPDALIFLNQANAAKVPLPANQVEPLILRVNAGDCVQVTLQNQFPQSLAGSFVAATQPFSAGPLSTINLNTSATVGLHPGVISLDVTQGDGVNVGMNPVQTVAPAPNGQPPNSTTYTWYAGNRTTDSTGKVTYTPMEFGSIGLRSSDPLVQPSQGLVGALIVEPKDATVSADPQNPNSQASAIVTKKDGTTFKEFVVVMQDSVCTGDPCSNYDSSPGAINYRTEPEDSRFPQGDADKAKDCAPFLAALKANAKAAAHQLAVHAPKTAPATNCDPAALFSDQLVGGDPQTPVFQAQAGQPVRFRVVYAGGDTGQVVDVHGHVWQERPYLDVNGSQVIGDNSQRSEWFGAQQMDPNENADFVIAHAGGSQGVTGDYLFNTIFLSGSQGTWGILRVCQSLPCPPQTQTSMLDGNHMKLSGSASAPSVTIQAISSDGTSVDLGSATVASDGTWHFEVETSRIPAGATIHVSAQQQTSRRSAESAGN